MRGGRKSNPASGLFIAVIIACIFLLLAVIFKEQISELITEILTPIGPGGMIEEPVIRRP